MAIVTLIRPPSVVGRYALTLNPTPPLSSAYLAGSLIAAGHEVQLIDALGETLREMHPGDRPSILVNGLSVREIVARIRPDADALDSRQLQRYRLAGLVLFCGASYLTHPTRPLRSAYNIATRRYESRMEMSFGNLTRRLKSASRTAMEAT